MMSPETNIVNLKNNVRQLLSSLTTAVPDWAKASHVLSADLGWLYAQVVMAPSADWSHVTRGLLGKLTESEVTRALRERVVLDSQAQYRPVYAPYALACLLKTAQMLQLTTSGGEHAHAVGLVMRAVARDIQTAVPSTDLWLAHCFTLVRATDPNFFDPIIRLLITRTLAGRFPAGHFHALTTETCLDAFVFDELSTLHAGILLAHGMPETLADMHAPFLEAIHGLARYHLENTQPDNTTNQPWGLPAFANWADTFSFADQQFHDTRTWLSNHSQVSHGGGGLIAGLLADTLVVL